MATFRYTVTLPDGSTKTRNSDRVYTHAIGVMVRGEWHCSAFCGSPDLASKEMGTQQRLHARRVDVTDRGTEWRILPVEVA